MSDGTRWGEALRALQIAAWPEDAPLSQLSALSGAVDTVATWRRCDRATTRADRERSSACRDWPGASKLCGRRASATRSGSRGHRHRRVNGALAGELAPEDLASTIASMVASNRGAARQ
jgi:hypothetical protein